MRMGFLALAALVAAPWSAIAADPPVVFQTVPLNRGLEEIRAIAKLVGGEEAARAFNEKLKEKLGEKGFEGLDLERPILGYFVLGNKIEDLSVVVAVPVTGQKGFLSFYERMFGDKLTPGDAGLYEIPLPKGDDQPKAYLRFSGQHVYVAFGKNPAPALGPNALVAPDKLYNPAEKAFISIKGYADRLPKELRNQMGDTLKQLKMQLDALQLPPEAGEPARKAVDELIKLGNRYADLTQDADTTAARVFLDSASGEAAIEFAMTGKPGSELARAIASRQPSTNKFGGLITKDTVAGLKLQLPFFAKEIENASIIGLEAAQKQAEANAPPGFQGAIDEAFKGLIRTVKTGECDVAISLRGPDKDGLYTVVGAVAFEDPSGLEKELRALFKKELPPMYRGIFNWDVATVGKTNIHQIKVGGLMPPQAQKIFGEEASVTFAFAPHGIFVAFGPDAINTMKTALEVQKGPSPPFEIVVNPKRIANLIKAAGLDVPESFGTKDMQFSALALTIEGGKELRLRLSTNLKAFEGVGGFGLPGAGAAKPTKQEFKK